MEVQLWRGFQKVSNKLLFLLLNVMRCRLLQGVDTHTSVSHVRVRRLSSSTVQVKWREVISLLLQTLDIQLNPVQGSRTLETVADGVIFACNSEAVIEALGEGL